MKNNVLEKNKWLWGAKFFALILTMFSTYHVFWREFNGYGSVGRPLATISAVVMIDVLVIAFMLIIESPDYTCYEKLPFVVTLIALYGGILVIGYFDNHEISSVVPRIGLGALIFSDIALWWSQYFGREEVEIRLRNKEVMTRRREKVRAWRRAITSKKVRQAREHSFLADELASLNPKKVVKEQKKVVKEPKKEEKSLPEGVVHLENGNYAWERDGELVTESASGKPYSARGAQIALARYQKSGN